MADLAHKLTDDELDALEKKIKREYERAGKEVEKKAAEYFARFETRDATKLEEVAAGKLTRRDYITWRTNQMLTGKRWTDLRDQLASDLSAINQNSAMLMGERMNRVFALNRNFAAYTLEHGLGLNLQFTLYNERTVARLLRENPRLLPKPSPNAKIDIPWNKAKINSEITQAVLQGESIPKIAARLQTVTDMNHNSAIRNARTAMTGAQNAGRLDSYEYAQGIGIRLQKEWLATLDDRTRDEHRALDGQKVDIDEPFTVDGQDIMYPGDPAAEGYLVYGCRCTMISSVADVDELDPVYRKDNISGELVADMTYKEWESARNGG